MTWNLFCSFILLFARIFCLILTSLEFHLSNKKKIENDNFSLLMRFNWMCLSQRRLENIYPRLKFLQDIHFILTCNVTNIIFYIVITQRPVNWTTNVKVLSILKCIVSTDGTLLFSIYCFTFNSCFCNWQIHIQVFFCSKIRF